MTFQAMTEAARAKGIEIDDLAKGIELSPTTFRAYLRGKASPSAAMALERLLLSLGVLESNHPAENPVIEQISLKDALNTWAGAFDDCHRLKSGATVRVAEPDDGSGEVVMLSGAIASKLADVMRGYALALENAEVKPAEEVATSSADTAKEEQGAA